VRVKNIKWYAACKQNLTSLAHPCRSFAFPVANSGKKKQKRGFKSHAVSDHYLEEWAPTL